MNELLFITQALLIVGFTLIVFRMGAMALSAWTIFLAFLANLFVLKQIDLFGWTVTASDPYAIGCLFSLNGMQEFFSKERAESTSRTCLFFFLFFALASQIHLLYRPSLFDTTQTAYHAILSPAPRLLFASLASFALVQRFDIVLFAFIQKRLPHLPFTYRTTLSMVCSQLLDTLLFTFVGLYGLVASPFSIVLLSTSLKLFTLLLITPFFRWAKA